MYDVDVIVVGARCAGSLTALLLARRGHRVLLVDRDRVGSDILCGGYLAPCGVTALANHGLLERLKSSGCPRADRTRLVVGTASFDLPGMTYSPGRRVLDGLLAEEAAQAGAEVRERFTVTDLVWDDERVVGVVGHGENGRSVVETARVTVGADGRHSFVASALGVHGSSETPSTSCCYYARWGGAEAVAPEVHLAEGGAVSLFPTSDGLTCVVATLPVSRWAAFKRAPEASYMDHLRGFPGVRDSLATAQRQSRFFGTADLGGCFRPAWGQGWALVGDAGHHRAPLLGGGMGDALIQATLLAQVLDDGMTGQAPLDRGLRAYEETRDLLWRPVAEATAQVASFAWSLGELPRRIEALHVASARVARVLHDGVGGAPAPA